MGSDSMAQAGLSSNVNSSSRSAGKGILRSLMGACGSSTNFLTEDDIEYIANNTALSKEQVEEQYNNFLIKHKDGKISKKSFLGMIKDCYPSAYSDQLGKLVFRMYDANNDGYIDFREFMVVLYVMSSGTPEQNLRQIFRVFDINSDGAISLKELRRVVKVLSKLITDADVEKMSEEVIAKTAFKEMDDNGDGSVSEDEFIAACLSHKKVCTTLTLKIVDVFVNI